jgi:hypothetical protein
MTTLNVNEGASSSAGSHNELSSLLPTSSEPAITPSSESQQQNQTLTTVKNEVVLDHISDVFHGRVENRSRMRNRQVR